MIEGARVLIAGCGYVGAALANRLAREGARVWGLRRATGALPSGVEPLEADLTDPVSLRVIPERLDFVFYTAAPDRSDPHGYRSTYVDGVRNLLGALMRQGHTPRRVCFTSSTGVYAQNDGGWVDEDSPTEPESESGGILLEGEHLVLDSGFPATVLRLGGIYGPGRTRLIDEVVAGTARCPPGAPAWSNRIHRDDCAGALAHLMRLSDPGSHYIAVDREPAPLCEILRWIARRLGAAEPPIAEAGSAPGRAGRRTNKRCSSARLVASGYEFTHPTYREGFESLLSGR
jgi:nucleoside-diphosphate-sugar epimerase